MNFQYCRKCERRFPVIQVSCENEELLTTCSSCGFKQKAQKEVELTDEHLERLDEMYGAVFNLCKVLTGNDDLEWNMSFIGDITDAAIAILIKNGISDKIYYPAVETCKDGSQYIVNY